MFFDHINNGNIIVHNNNENYDIFYNSDSTIVATSYVNKNANN